MAWLDLSACMWQFSARQLTLLLALSTLLCALGLAALVLSRGKGWLRVAGAGIFFLGLTWLYAVVVPPFQAPDEPTHFLGLLSMLGRSSQTAQVEEWASRGHFTDIRFQPKTKFRPEWCGRYAPENLTKYFMPVEMEARSPLTARFWRGLQPFFADFRVQGCLLAMRLLNGLLVAGFYTLALAVLWRCEPPAAGDAPAIPASALGSAVLLYVPALPFFSMHVSNYPLLIAAGILATAIAFAAVFLERRPLWSGGLLGLAVFMLMFSGRGGYPFAGFMLLLTVAGVLLPRSNPEAPAFERERGPGGAAAFWAVFTLGWLLSWLFLGRPDLSPILSLVSALASKRTWALPVAKWSLVFVPFICYAAEALLSRCPRPKPTRRQLRLLAVPGILWFSVGILGPLWGTGHYLANIEMRPVPVSAFAYLVRVQKAFWGSQWLGSPDYFLVRNFWTGFGWLETLLPAAVVTSLGLLVSGGNLFAWLKAFAAASLPLLCRLWLWSLTCILYLCALAIGAQSVPVNLHGRYLLLFYLLFLPVGFAGFFSCLAQWRSLFRTNGVPPTRLVAAGPTAPRAVWNAMLALCASLHGYTLWFLANRYF